MTDTNVLIYAHDPTNLEKHSRAVAHIARLARERSLVVSAQVLNEFYARTTRPNKPPALSHAQAAAVVEGIIASATVLPLTAATTLRALQGRVEYGLSWWNALLWATARENGITQIYTEDLPGRPEIDGVRYLNPLAQDGGG